MGLIQSVEEIKREKIDFPQGRWEFCLQTAFGLKTVTSTPSVIFRLLACLVDFGMCQTPQLHEPIPKQKSVFLSSSLFYHLYVYKLYNPIDCFPGDPWLRQRWKSKGKLLLFCIIRMYSALRQIYIFYVIGGSM